MYEAALRIARTKIRGGPDAPFFKRPYLDAAFNGNLYLWDTAFIATWAKYHQDELPVAAALDNFYAMQESDGYIDREYNADGRPVYPKTHPVGINPPLLAMAELELFSILPDLDRLRRVYPKLLAQHRWISAAYGADDGLFFSDQTGSGMDNLNRYPPGWTDDGQGLPMDWSQCTVRREQFMEWPNFLGLSWNRQGRMVDMSAQMAFNTRNLRRIAELIGRTEDFVELDAQHRRIFDAVNERCWSEADGFYFDLAYGKQLPQFHIGAYWTLWADLVPAERRARLVAHLTSPTKFGREVPVPSLAADEPRYEKFGGYWRGGVWPPTNYMVFRGLRHVGEEELARNLARKFYDVVNFVFERTGTLWENYAPELWSYGKPAKEDFCGWTALVPIAIGREFVFIDDGK